MAKIRRNRIVIKLKPSERKTILSMIKKGSETGRPIRRAMLLRLLDRGFTSPKAAEIVGVTAKSARDVAQRYNENGLEAALYDRPHSGQPPTMSTRQKTQIVAMVCASPPDGYARWNVRLIAEEAVKRKLAKKTNRETIRILLKTHDLKPWLKKNVVHGRTDSRVPQEDGRRS